MLRRGHSIIKADRAIEFSFQPQHDTGLRCISTTHRLDFNLMEIQMLFLPSWDLQL
jgi:hypothetical protein